MRTRATRRLAAMITVAALALAGIAAPVAAKPGGGHGKQDKTEHADHGRGRKPVKVSRFTAVGFVEAVDTDLVVMEVKGGLRGLKGETIEVTVADGARVKVDGEPATLHDVDVTMRVVVSGVRKGSGDAVTYTASRVYARTPDSDEEEDEEPHH